jgi:hypothetical protein
MIFRYAIKINYVDCFLNIFLLTKLIDHSDVNPLCAIGSSRSNFVENQGNFIIEDVIEEKIEMPLFAASLSGLPSRFVTTLSNAAHPGISVCTTSLMLCVKYRLL